jgi:hypothetical protein
MPFGVTAAHIRVPDSEQSLGASGAESLLRRRWVFEVIYVGIVLAAVALILSIVGRSSGWPIGDAFTEELVLVRLYAAHFRHLDFFPVWSSSDALGLGSPVLLYYQKAFFYLAGLIYILFGGALKPTLVVTVAIFLIVGAYGMRCTLALITPSRLLCTVGSVGFIFTNYAFTDWISRGDLPEFSAMMIVPWLLYWCLYLIIRRRVSFVLIPVLVLLVDAHSGIALISIFTLAAAMLTFLVVAGRQGLRAIASRLAIAVGGAALLLAPTLLAELRMAQFYDPASKTQHYGTISDSYISFGAYLFGGSYHWLRTGPHTFVQIDFAIWIPIVLALLVLIAAGRHLKLGLLAGRSRQERSVILFLSATLLLYLFLQLRMSLFLYRLFSPLQVIVYPFRMMALITPLGIILIVQLTDPLYRRYEKHLAPKVVAVLWLVSIILLSPITESWKQSPSVFSNANQFMPVQLSSPPPYVDYRTFKGLPTLTGGFLYPEFLPEVFPAHRPELYDDTELYKYLHDSQLGAASLSGVPCSVESPVHTPLESLQLTFEVRCAGPTRLALPISYNAYSTILVATHGEALGRIPYFHARSDPRIIINVHSSHPEVVVVHLPTLWGILTN